MRFRFRNWEGELLTDILSLSKTPSDTDIYDKDHLRYEANEWCICGVNFKGNNNWRVVDLVTANVTSKDEEKVYEILLHGIEARMNEQILIGNYGAMDFIQFVVSA